MTSIRRTKTKRPKDINELTRLYEEAKNKQLIASARDKVKYYRSIEKGTSVPRYSPQTMELQKEIGRIRSVLCRRKNELASRQNNNSD